MSTTIALIYHKFYSGDNLYKEKVSKNLLIDFDLKYILLIYTFFIKLFLRDETKLGNSLIPYNPKDEKFHNMITRITQLFEDWPKNFFSFLKVYENSPKSKPKFDRGSLINTFGYFYIDLFGKYSHPSFRFIQKEFENYINENWDKTLLSHSKFLNINADQARFVSTTEVAKILNTHHAYVRKLVSNGYLEAKLTSDRNPYLLISRESVENYLHNKKLYIGREEICEIFNISYQSVVLLEKRNLLKVKRAHYIDDNLDYQYDRNKVYQLLGIIERRYKRGKKIKHINPKSSEEKLVDIITSTKYVVGTNLADIITLIITGKLYPIAINKSEVGFKKYFLSGKEVQNKVYEYKLQERNGVFSIPELMRYLCISRGLIGRIIESGLISTSKTMQKPFVLVKDAISFKQNYITLSHLSNLCSVEYKLLLKEINANKIFPVIDGSYKKNKVYKIEDLVTKMDFKIKA